MESRYTIIKVSSDDYFVNSHLYQHIKNNYYSFRSCLYGETYISDIPSKSTYSINYNNQMRIYEDTPAPNRFGYKMFSLKSKSRENLTIFIKTKGWFKNNKLKIKLENNLFEKIIGFTKKYTPIKGKKENPHNVFILCCTKSGNYFVHTGLINSSTPKKIVIKKIDYKYYLQ